MDSDLSHRTNDAPFLSRHVTTGGPQATLAQTRRGAGHSGTHAGHSQAARDSPRHHGCEKKVSPTVIADSLLSRPSMQRSIQR